MKTPSRMGHRVAVALLAAASCGAGCGGNDGGGPGGVDAGFVASDGGGVIAPAPPAAPVLTPCATGWRAVEGGGVMTCEPWPESGRADCPADEAHFAGEAGCAHVGNACPKSGEYAEDLPTDRAVFYVRVAAPMGGDGSLTRPFRRIADGVAAARTTGGVVALARGRYDQAIGLEAGVTVWGACTADTIISPSSAADDTLSVGVRVGERGELRNVTIDGGSGPAIGALGAGTILTVDGVVIRNAPVYGLYASMGAVVHARDVIVRDMLAGTTGEAGNGIAAFRGGMIDATHVALERTRRAGVVSVDPGTRVVVEDSAIVEVLSRSDTRESGVALLAEGGGAIEARRCALEGTRLHGVWVKEAGSTLLLEDTVVRDVAGLETDGTFGNGLAADDGAAVTVRRVTIERAREVGVLVLAARLSAEDLVVRDMLGSEATGLTGRGIEAERSSTITLTRVDIGQVHDAALVVGQGSSITASDVSIHDVLPRVADLGGGRGMNLQDVASCTIERVSVDRAREVAVTIVGPPSSATLRDIAVRDTTGREVDGLGGRGIVVALGANVTIERALIERARDVGLISVQAGARLRAMHVTVRDIAPQACTTADCAGFGHGIVATYGGALTLEGFTVARAAACGVMVANDGSLDLSRGEVTASEIGACIQIDGYDTGRLSSSVSYRDNGSNLQATTLPVPSSEVSGGL